MESRFSCVAVCLLFIPVLFTPAGLPDRDRESCASPPTASGGGAPARGSGDVELYELQSYTIIKTREPVVVDGDCSDYAQANSIDLGGADVRLLYDDGAIYACMSMEDDQLNADEVVRDGTVWIDDAFALTFSTGNNKTTLKEAGDYKFIVNALNTQHDEQGAGASWNTEWDTTFVSVVDAVGTINNNADVDSSIGIELRVDWAAWGIAAPEAGSIWGFNVSITDKDADDTSGANWCITSGNPNDPSGWGELLFADVGDCAEGTMDCNDDPADGCETDVATDVENCGDCAHTCDLSNARSGCVTGACVIVSCEGDYLDCNREASDGCEVDPGGDDSNCGACGRTCPYGRVCEQGECHINCGEGAVERDGGCFPDDQAGGCGTIRDAGRCGTLVLSLMVLTFGWLGTARSPRKRIR